jgi:hypothetical protein
MTEQPDMPPARHSALPGMTRLVAAIAILLIAGLAVLVVLDAISLALFGEFTKQILLTASIVILAGIAIALLSRTGKS